MHVTYCPVCNTFLYTNSKMHYCRKCRTLISVLDIDYMEFSRLSVNERYKLAYQLTEEHKKSGDM